MKILLFVIFIVVQALICKGQLTNEISDEVAKEKWFLNSRYGLVYEAPKILEKVDFEMPEGAEMVNNFNIYIYKEINLMLQMFVMETEQETFDLEVGLEGQITNQLLQANAKNITIEFYYPEKLNSIFCDGTAEINGSPLTIRGFATFNGKGRSCSLFGISDPSKTSISKLNRVFNSIKIIDY